MVSGRPMGSETYPHVGSRCDVHSTLRYWLLDVPGCASYPERGGGMCHHIQRGVWIQLGTAAVVVPARDHASERTCQRRVDLNGDKLGIQHAGRRDYAVSAGSH